MGERDICVCVCMREEMRISVRVCIRMCVTLTENKLHTHTHTNACNWWLQSLFDIQWGEGGGTGLRAGVLKQETQDGYWCIDWMIRRDPGTDGSGGVNETYLQACWFTEPVWAGSDRVCVNNTDGRNERCCRGLSCGGIWSVEAEVGDSAGTRSDPCAVIVFAGR